MRLQLLLPRLHLLLMRLHLLVMRLHLLVMRLQLLLMGLAETILSRLLLRRRNLKLLCAFSSSIRPTSSRM